MSLFIFSVISQVELASKWGGGGGGGCFRTPLAYGPDLTKKLHLIKFLNQHSS